MFGNLGRMFFPKVYQVVPGKGYTVYAYLNDGSMRLYDATELIKKGGVFEPLKDKAVFDKTLTVINGTIAWDLEGNRDEYKCLDIDEEELFDCPIVDDIPAMTN